MFPAVAQASGAGVGGQLTLQSSHDLSGIGAHSGLFRKHVSNKDRSPPGGPFPRACVVRGLCHRGAPTSFVQVTPPPLAGSCVSPPEVEGTTGCDSDSEEFGTR